MSWLWLLVAALPSVLLSHLCLRRGAAARRELAALLDRAERAEAGLKLLGREVLVADAEGSVVHCGDAAAALLGPSGAAAGGAAPGRWEGLSLAALDAAFLPARGLEETCELTLDREGRRLGARLAPLRGADGRVRGHLVACRDLDAERAQRQQADRATQRQLRETATLEALDDGVLIADADLRIVWMNPALATLFAAPGPELAARLAGGGAREPLGASLDGLDTPELRFDDLRESGAVARAATLVVDGRRFELRAMPLHAADATLLGVAVRWKERTDVARLEGEILRVVRDLNRYQLASRVPLEGASGPLATLGAGLNQVGDSMAGIVSTVASLATQVSAGAATIAEENRQLGEQAARAARSLADTACSTREVGAAIRQLTESAHLARRLSDAMRGSAVHGGEVVHDAREAMSTIERTSRRMADVVGVIDGIAFQTNLLALNAAIEAAHAGPHGGGFAVVAAEVRALAARSKNAAREVHGLIDETLRCVAAGSARVTQSEAALQEIIGSANGVADVIVQIDAVAVQQAGGIERIDAAVLELERFTRDHNDLVERTAHESGALAEQSADLAGLMRRYRLPEVIVNAPRLRTRKRAGPPDRQGAAEPPSPCPLPAAAPAAELESALAG